MADRLGPDLADLLDPNDIVRLGADGTASADVSSVEVFCFSVDLAANQDSLAAAFDLLRAPSLRWVQAPGAGVELPVWSELVTRGVRLTNAAGIHAEPVAQYVFTYVLHWERQVARHQRQQAERRWTPITSDDLTTKTLGIVGFGGIGAAVARIAKAFDMRVIALRRSPIVSPHVDAAFRPDELHRLLEQSDYVVLTLPLTTATRGLIDRSALESMRSSAVLINVARGAVVDQAALLDTLETSAIRGAVLDVVDDEPLAADSPLWALDNCVITPHDAGYSPRAGERLGRLFLDNLARHLDRRPLVNEVSLDQMN